MAVLQSGKIKNIMKETDMKSQKVILVTIDGMRSDAFLTCGHPILQSIFQNASYTTDGSSVFPPVTLPAHLSIFYSVPPQRHGTLTNDYVAPVRPFDGLFEQIHHAHKTSAMFTGWEPLREVSRPGLLTFSEYAWAYSMESSDTYLTDRALVCIKEHKPDFLFLHLVETDEKGGHDNGWMSEKYLERLRIALDNLQRILDACKEKYTVIVSADHGGHDRMHGIDIPEDMVIPMFFFGKAFEAGRELHGLSLLDLSPTIAKLMGMPAVREWEGKCILD